jgi:chromosome transmission fidelity protein 18
MKTIESQTNVLARKSNEYPKTVSPNLNLTKIANATDGAKLLDMGNKKKPSRSSSNFFDRRFFLNTLYFLCEPLS